MFGGKNDNHDKLDIVDKNSVATHSAASSHDFLGITKACELQIALDRRAEWHPEHLGELLLKEGLITEAQLQEALGLQKAQPNQRLGQILEQMHVITAETVHVALGRKFGIPFIRLGTFDNDPAVLAKTPEELARSCCAFPLLYHGGHLVIAIEDPLDTQALDLLRFGTGTPIELVIATRKEIEFAINRHYGGSPGEIPAQDAAQEDVEDEKSLHEAEALSKAKPIVRLVDNIISEAVAAGASDIHLRPNEGKVDLLLRINGDLELKRTFKRNLLPALLSRFKILGDMNISEHRLPQDGKARYVEGHARLDLRMSVIPTVRGESLAVRLLYTDAAVRSLDELSFTPQDRVLLRSLLDRNQGMVLVTGPTGSGKTTTLYAALQEIRAQHRNIITIENPVEYTLADVEQIQVNHHINFTFPVALRQILRHDPNVIMVGEIRDRETAQIAVESSLTGHLLLSTLHTNSAAASVMRLVEMGVEPYLIGSTLLAVVAQRLVRKNCTHCTEVEAIADAHLASLKLGNDEKFYRGKGCDFCGRRGYSGRRAVYELMVMTPELQQALHTGVDTQEFQKIAVAGGMKTLTENALAVARSGEISLAEAYRIRLD